MWGDSKVSRYLDQTLTSIQAGGGGRRPIPGPVAW
jgi:hypothetical protein